MIVYYVWEFSCHSALRCPFHSSSASTEQVFCYPTSIVWVRPVCYPSPSVSLPRTHACEQHCITIMLLGARWDSTPKTSACVRACVRACARALRQGRSMWRVGRWTACFPVLVGLAAASPCLLSITRSCFSQDGWSRGAELFSRGVTRHTRVRLCVCACLRVCVLWMCVCCLLYTSPSPRDRG